MGAFPRLVSRYLYSIRLNSLAQEMLQELEMIIECFKFCVLITLHYYYYFKFFNFVLLWENLFLGNQRGDSPTRATLDEPTFPKFPY